MQPDFTFTHKGLEFAAYVESDPDTEAPWDAHDGHGPVRIVFGTLHDCGKRAGERVLHSYRGTIWLYDWQEAARLARRGGWNAEPYDAPRRIERAVRADFERLRGYLNDSWWWAGVCVTRANAAPSTHYDHALWGIESDSPDYHREVAYELAEQIIAEMPDTEPALADND